MSELGFDEAAILEDARAEAGGLSDFGADDFREGLSVLCRTYDENPFTTAGRRRSRRRLVDLLATRLRVQEAFRKHPEVRERRIEGPMVLTGLPRSGTSALFNLLGRDPAARPLLNWETRYPDPAEGLAPGAPDPRREAIERYLAKGREKNPEFTKVHFASADTPEECVLLHAVAFHGVQLGVEPMFAPYASWYRGQKLDGMYRYYADLLRLLDWQRPGERWLLKAPAHMWGIDALLAVFPDVSIVWSHRDPLLCIASIASMTHLLAQPLIDVDPKALGPVVMDFYATSLERGLAVRDGCDASRFVDVAHDDFVEDALAVADRIHRHFGLPLDGEARAAMQAHLEANPKGKHGTHRYDLESFGLDADRVRERFSDYVDRFQVKTG
ncbi:MAG: sulfotransferase [Planctomycetes bacterium]|nr:sulfotransferase [Planctomycetota bacterium]